MTEAFTEQTVRRIPRSFEQISQVAEVLNSAARSRRSTTRATQPPP